MAAEPKGIMKRLVELFSSLKLAITLLILLALVSVLGTMVPQEQDPAVYVMRYGEQGYGYLKLAGLIDLYHSWGFRVLMGLVTVNLLVCTLRRFKGIYARTFKPVTEKTADDIGRMRIANELPSPGSVALLERALTDKNYAITKRGRFIYAVKGRIGAWGDMITHFSILLVILGALVGSLGFISTVNVYVNGSTDVAYNWSAGRDEPLGFRLNVESFITTNYSARMKISVRDRDTGSLVGTFDVRDGGLFEIPGTTITVSPEEVDLVRKETLLNIYDRGVPVGVYDTGNPGVSLTGMSGIKYMFLLDTFEVPMLKSMMSTVMVERHGASIWHGVISVNNPCKFDGVLIYLTAADKDIVGRQYVGFQIVRDPGIPFVWAGFALILVGLFISFYFYHREVWVYAGDDSIMIGGRTNKNWDAFMQEYGGVIKSFVREVEP